MRNNGRGRKLSWTKQAVWNQVSHIRWPLMPSILSLGECSELLVRVGEVPSFYAGAAHSRKTQLSPEIQNATSSYDCLTVLAVYAHLTFRSPSRMSFFTGQCHTCSLTVGYRFLKVFEIPDLGAEV